ncbi:MAG: hypothetical protein ACXADH_04040 [Candidatus Kariarchaeaceae archaeon]
MNVRILEAQVHSALENITEAKLSLEAATNSLKGDSSTSIALTAEIEFHYYQLTLKEGDHERVIHHINLSINNYQLSGNPERAVTLLFDLLDYTWANNLQIDTFALIDKIETIIKKEVRDKKFKERSTAEINFRLGYLQSLSNEKDAENRLKKVAKQFSKLKLPEQEARAVIELARLESKRSPKDAEEIIRQAVSITRANELEDELGMALINLAMIRRIRGYHDDAKDSEDEALDILNASHDQFLLARTYVEAARMILLTTAEEEHLDIANDYTLRAGTVYNDLDSKYGKALATFLQGLIKISSGFAQDGISAITLTKINVKRLIKSNKTERIDSLLQNVLEIIIDESSFVKIPRRVETNFGHLGRLDQAFICYLLGIIVSPDNEQEGKELYQKGLILLGQLKERTDQFQKVLAFMGAKLRSPSGPSSSPSGLSSPPSGPSSPPNLGGPNDQQ